MEVPITFKNEKNQSLYGILHTPKSTYRNSARVGVNILNPGLKNRVAPNRLNVKIARMLCDNGFYVLRFDPSGIGDSEGQLSSKNEQVLDLWGMIQQKAFVEDTIFSNSFFIEKSNLDKLILIGQCGGGDTALLCAGSDKRIAQLILIDTPFRIVSSDLKMSEILVEDYEPNEILKEGLKYLFNVQKLKKLLTFNINWKIYLSVLGNKIINFIRFNNVKKTKIINERFNWELLKSFQQFCKRNGKTYFIFAENDFSLKEFNHDVRENFLDNSNYYKKLCKIDIIKNANHIYTETAWQKELMKNIINWLK